MDVINSLIFYILRTKYEDLPYETVHTAKKFLLDSLGTLIAGSSAPGCQEIANQIKDWGGKQEATAAVYGFKAPAPNAALINSMMMHSRDYDDTHDLSSVHGFAPVLPAVLASSEIMGSVSGKEFLTALVLGVDIVCRIALGMRLYKGWHYSSVCGTFGAIAGAGKIYRLSHDEMLNAIGIVYSLTAGNVQCVRDKALVKRMQPGFAAQAGLSAIAYAKRGITGSKNILEGDYGFYKLYDDNGNNEQFLRSENRGEYGIHKVNYELGKRYEIKYLSMKPYPCCRYTHPAIDGSLEFIKKYNIDTKNIVGAKVFVSKLVYDAVGKPFEIDEKGPQQVKAQFSIPYTVAVTLTKRRRPEISDFEEEIIRNDQDVIEMTKKIKVEVDSALNGRIPETLVFQTDKHSYSITIGYLKGSPDNPMTNEECHEKLLACARFSANPISDDKIHTIIERTMNIEKVKEVSELISLLR
jgi:2-methylcitrate dehydratase PrpD